MRCEVGHIEMRGEFQDRPELCNNPNATTFIAYDGITLRGLMCDLIVTEHIMHVYII